MHGEAALKIFIVSLLTRCNLYSSLPVATIRCGRNRQHGKLRQLIFFLVSDDYLFDK